MKRVKLTCVTADPGSGAAPLITARSASRVAGSRQRVLLQTAKGFWRADQTADPFTTADAGTETPAAIARTA